MKHKVIGEYKKPQIWHTKFCYIYDIKKYKITKFEKTGHDDLRMFDLSLPLGTPGGSLGAKKGVSSELAYPADPKELPE